LPFDDNPKKVGVSFDKAIPGGLSLVDWGCEDGHGFFVDASSLKHELNPEEGADSLAVKALFELVTKDDSYPCIIFIKNIVKAILSSYDRYANFKQQLQKTKGRLVVIG